MTIKINTQKNNNKKNKRNKTNKTNKTKKNYVNRRSYNKTLMGGATNPHSLKKNPDIPIGRKINCMNFNSNGQFIITGYMSKNDKQNFVKVWDISTNTCITTIFLDKNENPNSVGFSPNDEFIVIGTFYKIIVIDFESETEEKVFESEQKMCIVTGFSLDGEFLVSGNKNNIEFWEVKKKWKHLHTLSGHTNTVNCISFSPDKKYFVSGSADTTVKLWNIKSGKCVQTINEHTQRVKFVRFSPDGKWIAIGSDDDMVTVWRYKVETNSKNKNHNNNNNNKNNNNNSILRWRSKTKKLSKSISKKLSNSVNLLWKLNNKIEFCKLNQKIELPNFFDLINIAFSPDSNYLLFGASSGTISIYILSPTSNNWEFLKKFENEDSLHSIEFNSGYTNVNSTNTLLCLNHFTKGEFNSRIYSSSQAALNINNFTKELTKDTNNKPLFASTFQDHYRLWSANSICK